MRFRIAVANVGIVALGVVLPFFSVASALTSVSLSWTATGDDARVGTATQYSLRYSSNLITESNFFNAVPISGVPAPRVSGTRETFTANGLPDYTTMYYALKARDEAGNWSPISNVLKHVRSTVSVPSPLTLAFSQPMPNPASSAARFAVTLPFPDMIRVEAFDVRGARVRVLADGLYAAGQWDIVWDLRDSGGSRVNPGMYMIRAKVSDTTWNRRIIVTS